VENVVRLPQDEQITFLVQQHEAFADRLHKVEQGLADNNAKMTSLESSIQSMRAAIRKTSAVSTENNSLLYKVLVAVQGQHDSGLEVPGMASRMLRLEERATKSEEKNEALALKDIEHDNFKFRVYLVAGIIATTIGGLSLRFAPYLSQILALLSQ